MKILANDGLSQAGIDQLEKAGMQVELTHVAQEQLDNYINENQIEVLIVRSATEVRSFLIDNCPSLKVVARGGVGMDNIDVEYAREAGVEVINTPQASSHSVAELVFAHLMGMVRFLHDSNRSMPLEGDANFKGLKKAYSQGRELRGKTMGIFGLGQIGQATAKLALSLGMKVVAYDPYVDSIQLELEFFDGQSVFFDIQPETKEEVLKQSDFVSLHVPSQETYLIGKEELSLMKNDAILINASRGDVVDEVALVEALSSDQLSFAALDVFENEPSPAIQVLMHPQISLSPHIGAATMEAQERIGTELADKIIRISETL
ncbi:D-2-hydroxyacid dehydrogenase [Flavobacteriaceae bacterium]|nr:D-2-hydroxyacid dehydrogenase [Flavobacteriaceae bacterium]